MAEVFFMQCTILFKITYINLRKLIVIEVYNLSSTCNTGKKNTVCYENKVQTVMVNNSNKTNKQLSPLLIEHVYTVNFLFFSFVLRMKEYEREKRLLKREKRIGAKQSKEDLIA
jgi:hypothetical protein